MGSSMMHLAATEKLLGLRELQDAPRLRFGAVLPDFCTGDGHLKITVCGGRRQTYDLTRFRRSFGDLLRRDALYLGYYLHLVQDLAFRAFVYGELHFDPTPEGNVARLHSDYALCNAPLAETYGLSAPPEAPAGFDREPIRTLGRFDLPLLASSMQTWFSAPRTEAAPWFFTPEMAEHYVEWAAACCLRELDVLENGGAPLDELAAAWEIPR